MDYSSALCSLAPVVSWMYRGQSRHVTLRFEGFALSKRWRRTLESVAAVSDPCKPTSSSTQAPLLQLQCSRVPSLQLSAQVLLLLPVVSSPWVRYQQLSLASLTCFPRRQKGVSTTPPQPQSEREIDARPNSDKPPDAISIGSPPLRVQSLNAARVARARERGRLLQFVTSVVQAFGWLPGASTSAVGEELIQMNGSWTVSSSRTIDVSGQRREWDERLVCEAISASPQTRHLISAHVMCCGMGRQMPSLRADSDVKRVL